MTGIDSVCVFSDCSFLTKSLTVSKAGALAVVVRDNDIENAQFMIDMIDDGTGRSVDIAAFFMLGKDGSVLSLCVVYDSVFLCLSVYLSVTLVDSLL